MRRVLKIYFSKDSRGFEPCLFLPLLREAVARLFSKAKPTPVPDFDPNAGESFFLKEGDHRVWVELAVHAFSENEIPAYLARARHLEKLFPSGLSALLVAPGFEPVVQEILAMIRIPVRFFRYQLGTTRGVSGPESALWIEEIFGRGDRKDPSPPASPEGLSAFSSQEPHPDSIRLTREELREFIDLELSTFSHPASLPDK